MNKFAAQLQAGNWARWWVCQCCMLVHANGECGEGCHDDEPLGKVPDTADVAMGLFADEHADDCTEADRTEGRCECDRIPFSWSWCPGCGSGLGGERYALTVVFDMREEG